MSGLEVLLFACLALAVVAAALLGYRYRRDLAAARAAQQRAEAAAERLTELVGSAEEVIVGTTPEGEILSWNLAAERVYGFEATEAMDTALGELVVPIEREDELPDVRSALEGGEQTVRYETVHRRRDGGRLDVAVSVSAVRDSRGEIAALWWLARDVSGEKRARDDLRRLATIVESSEEAIISVTPDGRIASWNAGAERLYGYPRESVVGEPVSILIPRRLSGEEWELLDRVMSGEEIPHFETHRLTKDGRELAVALTLSPLRETDGRIVGLAAIARDITAQRRSEEEVHRLTDHDPLTGLLNGRRFEHELEHQLSEKAGDGGPGAVLLLNVDRMRDVNVTLGHRVGDELLVAIGRTLNDRMETGDVLARVGGDEFAVLLPDATRARAEGTARDLLAGLRRQPLPADGEQVEVTASVGIVLLPRGATVDGDGVLAAATAALYEAKEFGRDRIAVSTRAQAGDA